jgi:hypothetical protein
MIRKALLAIATVSVLASGVTVAQAQKPKKSCPFKSAEQCFQTCSSRGGQVQYCNRWCVDRMKGC